MGNLTVAAITFTVNCNGCVFVCFLFPALTVQNRPLLTSESITGQEIQVFLMCQNVKQVIRSVLPCCQNQFDLVFWKCCWPASAPVSLFFATSNAPGTASKKTNQKPKHKPNKTPNRFTCIIAHFLFSFLSTVQFLPKMQCLLTSRSHRVKSGATVEAVQLYRCNKT